MRVLICGAGIAGPALAWWLRHHGHTPVVVERAPGPRAGGQAVDVRGAALTVIERMGLLDDLRVRRTTMAGMSVLGPDGTELMRSTEYAASSGRLDSPDVEVLREDLVGLLLDHTRDVEYRWGDTIAALTPDGVVTFAGGRTDRFDLVVGADGLWSATRRLVFGPIEPLHLGSYVAVFTTPNLLGLENWQVWLHNETAGGGISTARANTELRVSIGFYAEPFDYDRGDLGLQRRLVRERTASLGWELPKLLAAMDDAEDFYFAPMAQIHLDTWSRGRVTLLGDAAYCPSPLSGQGTSLALVGAHVLASAVAADGVDGLRAYESRLRPFVTANQALATERPGQPAAEESLEKAKNAITLS
jgi:2-polyprenyl-6-methoxyphenol hydroxylase-like FAD-dependent oxidoreductase